MKLLTWYYNRFANLRVKAGTKSIFVISIMNSLGLVYLSSWHLSFYSWLSLGGIERLSPIATELSIHLPIIYFTIIAFALLPTITLCFIHVTLLGQKLGFHAITKFEMYYFRKYRRSSPLIESAFRLQQKFLGLDIRTKRKILLIGIVLGVAYFILRNEHLFFQSQVLI